MESTLCKIQYVGKAQTPYNIRSKNHRLDVSDPNATPAQQSSISQPRQIHLHQSIDKRDKPTEVIQDILKKTFGSITFGNFWIKHPHGLN